MSLTKTFKGQSNCFVVIYDSSRSDLIMKILLPGEKVILHHNVANRHNYENLEHYKTMSFVMGPTDKSTKLQQLLIANGLLERGRGEDDDLRFRSGNKNWHIKQQKINAVESLIKEAWQEFHSD